MGSPYDFLSVAAFGVLFSYFFFMTDRNPRLLMQFLVSAVSFAVANQLGNAALKSQSVVLHGMALVLLVAGAGYAAIAARS